MKLSPEIAAMISSSDVYAISAVSRRLAVHAEVSVASTTASSFYVSSSLTFGQGIVAVVVSTFA